jgi:mannose-1-phosphate guanylyltransferase
MEHASGVSAVPLRAGWDDVGSWDASARLREEQGQAAGSSVVLVESPGTAVFGGRRLVAVVGVPRAVIVDAGDALLVVARDRAEKVRDVVAVLRERGRKDLL